MIYILSGDRFEQFLHRIMQWIQQHPNQPAIEVNNVNISQKNGKADLQDFYENYDTPQNTFIYNEDLNEFIGIVGQSAQVNRQVRIIISSLHGYLYHPSQHSASSAAGMPCKAPKFATFEGSSKYFKSQISHQKGKGIGKFLYEKLASNIFKPKGWTKPVINVTYPPGMPPKSTLIQMENSAYEPVSGAAKQIDGWNLITATDTIKFYKKNNTIIVAIRGTADMSDVSADAQLAIRGVRPTTRYQKDLKTMQQVKKQFPNALYYGLGHSLGGALLDQFIADGYIQRGVSYNPAVEKQYLNSDKNYRIYMENDPLFNTMGKYSRIGEVRPQSAVSKIDAIASAQSIKAHLLSNFVGGMKGGAVDVFPFQTESGDDIQKMDLDLKRLPNFNVNKIETVEFEDMIDDKYHIYSAHHYMIPEYHDNNGDVHRPAEENYNITEYTPEIIEIEDFRNVPPQFQKEWDGIKYDEREWHQLRLIIRDFAKKYPIIED